MPDYYNSDNYNRPPQPASQPTQIPQPQQPIGQQPQQPAQKPQLPNMPQKPVQAAPVGKRPVKKKGGSNKVFLIIIAVLLLIIIGVVAWLIIATAASNKAKEEALNAQQQAELAFEQYKMQQEFDELNSQFMTLEDQRIQIMDDSVKRELEEKYEAARLKVEILEKQLRDQRNMSQQEIEKLKGEIATLREILKNYLAQIDQLNRENEQLRAENEHLQNQNTNLTNQVAETSRQNEHLSERMTLAEKLNVTGVQLMALNKKGGNEKKVQKAKQLMVTFTIPQNNSTPVGEKTIYLRIVSPSGQLLGNAGSFPFEGTTLACSAKKTIEYAGQEIGGINIYWDVNTALTPGSYTVELFTDGYRLCSKSLNLN